jgi:hypothetical protein
MMNRIKNWFVAYIESLRSKRSSTVRSMFSFSILGALLLLGASVITSKEVSYIRLSADKSVVQAGDRISLDIYAYAHVPVNAVAITLRFEPDAVEVIGVDRGQSVLTIWTEDPVVGSDKVTLSGGTFKKGFVGEHKVATINLKAKQSGQSEFIASNVTLLAGDGRGTPVTVAESNDSSLSLVIYDENASPEDIGVEVSVAIVTDIDGDGKVSLKDISSFMGAWTSRSRTYDFNGDGKMSFKDFSIILADAFRGN